MLHTVFFPLRIAEAEAAGISRAQLRGRAWRSVGPGLYVPARVPDGPELRLAAATRRLPDGFVFAGATAGWLHGLDLPPCAPIEAIVPIQTGVWARSQIRIRRAAVPDEDRVLVQRLPATSRLRTVADLAARPPLVEAVIAADMALHRKLVTVSELVGVAASSRPGVRQLRRVLALMDPNAESPMETRLRLLLVQAGLPRPQSQVTLRDDRGTFLGRPDFYYSQRRLCIEFDGGLHRDRLVEDNRRQNRLMTAGYTILRFTAADVLRQPGRVASDVRWALMRAAA